MFDDNEPTPKSDLFKRPSDDELNRLSVGELEERIVWLEDEVVRTKGIRAGKQGAFSDAEAVFKK